MNNEFQVYSPKIQNARIVSYSGNTLRIQALVNAGNDLFSESNKFYVGYSVINGAVKDYPVSSYPYPSIGNQYMEFYLILPRDYLQQHTGQTLVVAIWDRMPSESASRLAEITLSAEGLLDQHIDDPIQLVGDTAGEIGKGVGETVDKAILIAALLALVVVLK